ncbi:MAG: helix-turn-helix domain-containing protein [Dehalococcoidia bacterium]|nr:helix-turn-helix domain-containing protein [Dehalococcoidia bacterium]
MAERPTDDRVSVAEAARRLGVSTSTVRRRVAAGELRALRDGRRRWVLLEGTAVEVGAAPTPANVTPFAASVDAAAQPSVAAAWAVRDRRTLAWLGTPTGAGPRFVSSLRSAMRYESPEEALQVAATLARDGWTVEVRSVFVETLAA